MKRRQFLEQIGLGASAILLIRSLGCNSSKRPPNVLMIVSDDLNDWIGCLGGHPDSRTPNIDRLCSRGMLFHNAYCSAPICNPSRASMMTGLRPSTTGVYGNRQPFRMSSKGKHADTLTQYFMKQGYHASGGGKIFHGKFPDPLSWNEFFPSLRSQSTPDPRPELRPANGMREGFGLDWGALSCSDQEMGDYQTVEYCIGQLQKQRDKSFFLACGIRKPHLPWYVPQKYFDLFPLENLILPSIKENDLDDVPAIGIKFANPKVHREIVRAGKWKEAVAAYLATIAFVDTLIGRLLDALDQSPHADNTIIVFWGDHGWHLGEKLHWKKSTLWEEGTRAPLMIAAPGVTSPNGHCRKPVSFLDIYPTLVDLCGLPEKPDLEGVSLSPLLREPEREWKRPALTTHLNGNHSVRSERWRYTRYLDGTEELFDHSEDELEWKNLANDPKYSSIKNELASWLPEIDAPDSPKVVWPSDDEIEGLKGMKQYWDTIDSLMERTGNP